MENHELKLPWYLSTWFIAIMFALWSIFWPCLIAGIVLLVLHIQATNKMQAQLAQQQAAINEQQANINQKQAEFDNKQSELDKKQSDTEAYCQKKQAEMEEIQKSLSKELDELQKEVTIAGSAIYIDEDKTSEEYKNQLSILRLKEKDLIKSDQALVITNDGKRKVINDNAKQILRCFNAESEIIIESVTAQNIDSLRNKLAKSFDTLNRIFQVDGIALTHELLEIKLEELHLVYSYQLKKEQEKEEQKAIRQQMLEEEKVRREIEKEKAKLEKEENQFKNEVGKLMKYMQKADDVEKQLYIDKIKELEEKLKQLEKDKENVLEREQNTRAGFVYVISNIGSFGENIYKIGMTRRLEPMDRIKELGDASVPFEFDVHAMIFSEDAPKLEHILHQTFRKYEVNKVNPRKEFFKVPLPEIEKVVLENHNATVTFTEVAKAEQYRQTLLLEQNQ